MCRRRMVQASLLAIGEALHSKSTAEGSTSSALIPDALRRVRLQGNVAKRSASAASGSTMHRSANELQRASAGHTAGPAATWCNACAGTMLCRMFHDAIV